MDWKGKRKQANKWEKKKDVDMKQWERSISSLLCGYVSSRGRDSIHGAKITLHCSLFHAYWRSYAGYSQQHMINIELVGK